MHSTSAKKRKRSSKRSKNKDDSGSRIRSRERLESKTQGDTCHRTYKQGKSSIPVFSHDRPCLADDENFKTSIQDISKLNNQLTVIRKSLKKKIKTLDMHRPNTDSASKKSDGYGTDLEEEKLN